MGLTQKLGTIPLAILTDASNNVGIGAAPSGTYKLEVTGTAKVSSTLLVSGAATFSSSVNIGTTASTIYGTLNIVQQSVSAPSFVRGIQLVHPNGTGGTGGYIGISMTGQKQGTIQVGDDGAGGNLLLQPQGGNVGIGTTSPDPYGFGYTSLTIQGGTYAGAGGMLHLITPATNANGQILGQINFNDGANLGAVISVRRESSSTTSNIQFYTNSSGTVAERMRITSGGFIGFGVTPNRPVVASYSVSGSVMEIINTRNSSSNDYALVTSLGSNANNTSSYHYIASTGGADKYYLYGNGTYQTVSDERLKKNISKVTDTYLDKVLGLNIVNYNWNEQEDGSPLEFGMIAQEVEKVIPSIVHEGREQEDGNIYKGIQASVLPYILIKAIQEMNTKLDEQNQTIQNLQEQNQDLKSRLDKAGL